MSWKNDGPAGAKARILVLDDNPEFRGQVAEALARAGFEVETHSNADQVLGEALEDRFDLVVTNYVMKGWQGLSFVNCLREKGKQVPAVMMTGSFHPGVFSAAKKVGVSYVMAMPINEEGIVRVVNRLLQDGSPRKMAACL